MQLLDDDAAAAVDEALHRLDRTGAGAHVHREQLVHGVELEPDPLASIVDAAVEPAPQPRRAEHDAAEREADASARRWNDEDAERAARGTEQQDPDRHPRAVVVRRHVDEPGLAERQRERRVLAALEDRAEPRSAASPGGPNSRATVDVEPADGRSAMTSASRPRRARDARCTAAPEARAAGRRHDERGGADGGDPGQIAPNASVQDRSCAQPRRVRAAEDAPLLVGASEMADPEEPTALSTPPTSTTTSPAGDP